MKYKDFKMMTMAEMKEVKGGNITDPDCKCKASCSETVGGTTYIGTCSEETTTIGGTTRTYCKCSRSGGTGCDY